MKVLVVVDMQNDFITGSLGTPEAKAIVPKVAQKIRDFDGGLIVFTEDTHFADDYLASQEGRNLPVKHCIAGTKGWEIEDSIKAASDYRKRERACDQVVLRKCTFGAFDMGEMLMEFSPDEIELVGLCTDICVISNAMILKAYFPDVPITVDASCCAGVTPESHNNALRAMQMCQIQITNWEV